MELSNVKFTLIGESYDPVEKVIYYPKMKCVEIFIGDGVITKSFMTEAQLGRLLREIAASNSTQTFEFEVCVD